MKFFSVVSLLMLVFSIGLAKDVQQGNEIFDTIKSIDSINWDLHNMPNDDKAKQLRLDKEEIIESLPKKILDKNYTITLDVQANQTNRMEQELIINNSALEEYNDKVASAKMTLDMLNIDLKACNALIDIRKRINVLSSDWLHQKSQVIQVSSTLLSDLESLQKDIGSLNISKKLESQKQRYLNRLATYVEIFTFFKRNPALFTSKHVMLHSAVHDLLDFMDRYIQITSDNLVIIKISLSLLSFIILWACRKLLTSIIVKLLNIVVHISNQDRELYKSIQGNILKPITLFLFAWSLNVSMDILYYPALSPDSIAVWFSVCYIINIAWFLIAIIKSYVAPILTNLTQKSNEGFRKEVINLILNILYAVVAIIAVLFILRDFGFNVSAIIASLGLGGLAVALAIKDVLANFFASVMLLFDNSFSQGDWIECSGIEGNVVEIGLRRTTVRTFDNALLFIPNAELASKIIKNWSRRKSGRRIKFSITIPFILQEDIKAYMQAIRDMIQADSNIAILSEINANSEHLVKKDIVNMDDYLGYKSGFYVNVESISDKGVCIGIDCFTKSISKKDFCKVKEELMFKVIALAKEHDIVLS